MSEIVIGQNITLNGKEYKITGKDKRSYVLERDGKNYKATTEKIDKILAQNARPKTPTLSYLQMKIEKNYMFDKSSRMPETEEEAMGLFVGLVCDMSPENLHQDGEASAADVRYTLRGVQSAWAELESIVGRRVTENEVLDWETKERKKKYE